MAEAKETPLSSQRERTSNVPKSGRNLSVPSGPGPKRPSSTIVTTEQNLDNSVDSPTRDDASFHIVKKLDTNVASLKNRILQLQDELAEKDAQVRDLSAELKKAEQSADEMASMVRTLQYQVNSLSPVGKGQRQKNDTSRFLDASKRQRDNGSFVQQKDLRRVMIRFLTPLASRVKRMRNEVDSFKQMVKEKIVAHTLAMQADGSTLLKMVTGYLSRLENKPAPPPPRPAPALKSKPEPAPAFPSQKTVTEKCERPHVTEETVNHVQDVVSALLDGVRRFYIAAGIPMDPPKLPRVHGFLPRWETIQITLTELRRNVEEAINHLHSQPLAKAPEANIQDEDAVDSDVIRSIMEREQRLKPKTISNAELHQIEEEQEEMQNHVARCAELLVQAKTDKGALEQLPEVFSEAEAFIDSLSDRFEEPKTADKAIQCNLDRNSRAGQSTSAAMVRPPPTNRGNAKVEEPKQLELQIVPVAVPDSPFQKTVKTIEELLRNTDPGDPRYAELQKLLEEAKTLAGDEAAQDGPWHKPKEHFKPSVSDDHKAVQRFQQWKLTYKLRLAKQRSLLGNVFHALRSWFYNNVDHKPAALNNNLPSAPTVASAAGTSVFANPSPAASAPQTAPVFRPRRGLSASPIRRPPMTLDSSATSKAFGSPLRPRSFTGDRSPVIPTMTQLMDMPSRNALRGSGSGSGYAGSPTMRHKLNPLPQSPTTSFPATVDPSPFGGGEGPQRFPVPPFAGFLLYRPSFAK